MQDRDYIYIRNRPIPHPVAVRDWVCGICESKLKTIWDNGWKTVCSQNPKHSQDSFIKESTLQRRIAEQMIQAQGLERVVDMLKDRNNEYGVPKRLRLVRIGKVRQGKMVQKGKKRYPVAVPYFILDPTTDNEQERAQMLADVKEAIAKYAPEQDLDEPTILPITFLANNDEIIAPESYKKRRGKKGMVWCAGDGETIQWKLDDDFRVEISNGEPVVSCPGSSRENRHPWCDDCTAEIEVNFVIRGYESTGTWQLRTKSMIFRDQFWTAIGMVRLMAEKGIIPGLVGVPFLLRRQTEDVTVPTQDGSLTVVNMPITNIEIDPMWFRDVMSRNPRLNLPEPEQPALLEEPTPDYPIEVEAEIVEPQTRKWYELAEADLPERPWEAMGVHEYVTKTMGHYAQTFEDFDEPAQEAQITAVRHTLYDTFHNKLDMPGEDSVKAIETVLWYLFDSPSLSQAKVKALHYWTMRPVTVAGKKGWQRTLEFPEELKRVYEAASELAEMAGQEGPTTDLTPEEIMARMGAKKVEFTE